jgi:hypothetical protein
MATGMDHGLLLSNSTRAGLHCRGLKSGRCFLIFYSHSRDGKPVIYDGIAFQRDIISEFEILHQGSLLLLAYMSPDPSRTS